MEPESVGLVIGVITALSPIIMALIALLSKRDDEEREWRARVEREMAAMGKKVDGEKDKS